MSAHRRAILTPDAACMRRLDNLTMEMRATSRPVAHIAPVEHVSAVEDIKHINDNDDIVSRLDNIERIISDGFSGLIKDIAELKDALKSMNIQVINPGYEYTEILEESEVDAVGERVLEMIRNK
jgi:hypothetical protein